MHIHKQAHTHEHRHTHTHTHTQGHTHTHTHRHDFKYTAALMVLELLPAGFWSAPRILELLPGFGRKMWKFIWTFMKNPLKRVLKNRKLKKVCYRFLPPLALLWWSAKFVLKFAKFQTFIAILSFEAKSARNMIHFLQALITAYSK